MLHWTRGLSGRRAPQSETEWLSPEAEEVRAELGDGAVTWAVEVGEDIAIRITQKIPTLADEVNAVVAIRRATTSTVWRALKLVAGLGESEVSLVSAEVEGIARDFARRGMELDDLLRTIRVGYAVLAADFLDAATLLLPPAESSAELRRISVLLFEVLDDFTADAAAAFIKEQSAWAAGISAARFDLVTRILAAEDLDTVHAEEVLGYSLEGPHVALIAWSTPNSARDLRGVVESTLRERGAASASLVLPVGLQTVWAWGAVLPGRSRPRNTLPSFDDAFVVVGEVGSGIHGFRQSHGEAKAVERLIRLRPAQIPCSVAYEHVALEVLLLSDPEAAKRFASHVLGPLAQDEPRMTELRSTLRRYLEMDHSLAKVASVEHISKNTVTYRINKALDLCGYSGEATTDLRAALRIHEWLAGPV
ncbi:PucR family transcriptional regulator [Rhodococcus rhodochrous]|uniref:Helix-turn-helix domain-containing protein n=1 Tax=Rhodococcus rhodochrous TaxID=1829 RepID=A0AA46WUS7_RHORH|nr:helix-turn-helix domain-containing protein [Rhodococcus rhodochrous]MCB8910580.1 helix-turn-helix domain-containing protein [Rhodococcus rhodochrous]UZF44764.1 helix-turn-helix domain-containing protein [Rhodococcus rhodochrous]